MPRWSKLQKQLYELIAPGIRFQIQCRVERYSKDSRTKVPYYWITLGKETIWHYPKDFPHRSAHFPHINDVSAISDLLRNYIDTPPGKLLTVSFANDLWGLTDILRAADRRIGSRQWLTLSQSVRNPAALKVLRARDALSKNPSPDSATKASRKSPSTKAGLEHQGRAT